MPPPGAPTCRLRAPGLGAISAQRTTAAFRTVVTEMRNARAGSAGRVATGRVGDVTGALVPRSAYDGPVALPPTR